ncbi:MAG: hypothetical protein EOO71_00645 [Myxococcaceae bacterium]|nr:MAG: hypothetical protein EOO71_00645 [Myxococcaceae bacterium]
MLPRLRPETVRAYLARLGNPGVSLDANGLSCLLRAHLRALPFHNLALLDEEANVPGVPPVEAAVEGNLAGIGGTCHLLTTPFVALLRTLGFEAWLAGATIRETGDHVVGVVRLPEGRFVVDVGSGHPCMHPLPLDGAGLDFTAYGTTFRFEQDGHEGHRLRRALPHGPWETLYRLTPEPRSHDAFSHPNTSPSLRAVRLSHWALASVQDGSYQRFAGGFASTRPVHGWEAMAELLHITFGLPEPLIQQALHALRRRVPDLLEGVRHSHPPLRVIVSLAVTDRAESADELLQSLIGNLGTREEGSVGVLILDNGQGREREREAALEGIIERSRGKGLQVTRLKARDELERLAPSQQCGLLPFGLDVPLPIGASRTLQTSLLHEHLRTGVLGLPHPGDGRGPVAVWMLDDDLSFRRLRGTSEGFLDEPVKDLLDRVETLWTHHPEVSVALGTCTGAPPIPGYATLRVQVHDLAGNLQELAEREPDTTWSPEPGPRHLPDYYYDHARGSADHLRTVFAWTPPGRAPWRVRDAFRTLCVAFTQVPHGQQITRPLLYQPVETLAPSRHRGGNTLFLDLDALVAAPYPVLRGEDGVMTRRADTLWAHLLAREPLLRLVQAELDLLHGRRDGDGNSPLATHQPDLVALRNFVEGQERGVVLARLLERESPEKPLAAEQEVSSRRDLLAHGREGLRREAEQARRALLRPEAWWWRDEADATTARACVVALEQVELLAGAVDALADPSLPERLADFARHVVSILPIWRTTWG